ncbi:hypothetical protein AGMMS49936_07580 [Endomicrobiia bacterium]|nr:hypothetical protein AGMMS49936_07580 [Endomicrobiia bacterium]
MTLSVREYMRRAGLKSYSKTKEQLSRDSNILFSRWLDWKEGKPFYLSHKTRYLDDITEIKNGKLTLTFSQGMAEMLVIRGYQMTMSNFYWKAGKVAKCLLYKYCTLKRTKLKKQKDNQDPNDFIVKAVRMLEYNNLLPSYKKVHDSTNRNHYKRIIVPLEKGLNELQDVGMFIWEYCRENKRSLSKEEMETKYLWKNFSKIYIRFISSSNNQK